MTTSNYKYGIQGQATDNASSFFLALTGFILYGFLATALFAHFAIQAHLQIGIWATLLIIVVAFTGIFVTRSESTFISFLGYNMIAIPFGLLIGPSVQHYSPNAVTHVLGMTAGITLVMGGSGVLYPSFYKNLGAPLFMGLLCLLGLRILQCFIPAMAVMTWIDYVSTGLFSLYIGYDMYQAYNDAWTTKNALTYAISLYLDILNLFLSLLGTNRSRD